MAKNGKAPTFNDAVDDLHQLWVVGVCKLGFEAELIDPDADFDSSVVV